jgi:DNA polymerase III sliding clamp (beta) subunit (PCNA family)
LPIRARTSAPRWISRARRAVSSWSSVRGPMIVAVIRMEINEDTLTMAATDRYRLAVRELRWTPVAPGLSAAVLVPDRCRVRSGDGVSRRAVRRA